MIKDKQFYTTIGNILKAQRKHQKIPIKQITEILGVSPQQLHKYETGKNRIPMDKFELYCGLINKDIDSITEWAMNIKVLE